MRFHWQNRPQCYRRVRGASHGSRDMGSIGEGGGSAHSIPPWWAGTEIDGAEYVFLGRKDEGTEGEGTEEECGFLSPGSRSATQPIMASMRSR